MESFNSRLRDELVDTEVLTCLAKVKVLAADWREDYATIPTRRSG